MKEVRTFKEKFDLRGADNSSFQERLKLAKVIPAANNVDEGLFTRSGKMSTGEKVFVDKAMTTQAANGVYEVPNGYISIKHGVVVSESIVND